MRLIPAKLHKSVLRIISNIGLILSLFLATSTVIAQVCYSPSSTLNSSGYTVNTPLQTTPGFPLSFFNDSIRFNSATFTGTARWVGGVRVQNVSPLGDLIYIQPDRATDYLNTNNDATYVFTFPKRTTTFSAVFSGLNNYDGTSIRASYQGVPVTITAANFSNLSSGMTLKDTDGTAGMDTVVSSNTSGDGTVNTNTYTLTISVPIDTLIINSGKDQSGNTGNVSIGISTFNYCVISPNLSVVKSSNGPWTIGRSGAQYTLNVTNSGQEATSGTVTVRDVLPTGITPNWTGTRTVDGFACTFSGQNVTCNRTSAIGIAGTASITLPVNVTTSAAVGTNSITNYASIGGGGDPYNSGSAPTPGTGCTNAAHCASNSTTVLSPNLTIGKTHSPATFVRGSTGTYSITVTNSGTAATSGTITVVDTLPTGLSVNGGAVGGITEGGTNAADWTCNSNAAAPQVITCTSTTAILNTTGSNTSVFSFVVNVAASAAASVVNNVEVSGGNEATANNGNNTASDTTPTGPSAPNIGLSKSWASAACPNPSNLESNPCSASAQPQLPGTDITYKIIFTNSGGQGAANLQIVDGIPANMDYKIGSAAVSSGVSFTIAFSSDYDPLNPTAATWGYTPVSGGGNATIGFAPAGYDRLVKAIRWSASGAIPNTSPNNTGNVSFITKIR